MTLDRYQDVLPEEEALPRFLPIDTETRKIRMHEETSAQPVASPIVVPPSEGTMLKAFGDWIVVKISGEQTGGAQVVLQGNAPPGGGPPPHIHHNEDETFLILSGSFRFLTSEQWSEPVGPGTVVHTPRGVRHTFRNVGDTPGTYWVIATPSGFEQFYARCAELFASSGKGIPDPAQIAAIAAEHGIEFVPPLTSS